jgi:hypothetical protein
MFICSRCKSQLSPPKKKAQEYVLSYNKPCLSINDIIKYSNINFIKITRKCKIKDMNHISQRNNLEKQCKSYEFMKNVMKLGNKI